MGLELEVENEEHGQQFVSRSGLSFNCLYFIRGRGFKLGNRNQLWNIGSRSILMDSVFENNFKNAFNDFKLL